MRRPALYRHGRRGLWLSALLTLGTVFEGQAQTGGPADTAAFGMLRRRPPATLAGVEAPVRVAASPGNEATMLRLASGALKIFFVNRPGDADKLMSITSTDGGLHWEAPQEEFALGGQAYYANRVLQDAAGTLHSIFHLFSKGDSGYHGRQLDLWYSRKLRGAPAWERPRKILNGYVGSIRSFIVLPGGRLLTAVAKAMPAAVQRPAAAQPDSGWHEIIALYSDDGGDTWSRSQNHVRVAVDPGQVTRYGGVEPALVACRDGSVWMLFRTNKGRLYQSRSRDGGRTWASPTPTPFISSDSPADILRLSDQRLILFGCSDQRWDDPRSYANGGREVLHAAISSDEGRSWKGFREVLTVPPAAAPERGDRGTAYPSAAATGDGRVALVSGQGQAKSIVLFDPQWLEQQEAADDFREGLDQWTLYGADSAVAWMPPAAQKAAGLRVCRSRAGPGDAAVWNFPMSRSGTLKLEVEASQESQGISLALTDHFSPAGDAQASEAGVVLFRVQFPETGRQVLSIRWDSRRGKAVLYMGGRRRAEKTFRRSAVLGLNYLRVGIPGTRPDPAGYVIRSVHMQGTGGAGADDDAD